MQVTSYDDPSKTFLGVRFVLFGFDSANADKLRSKLLQGGGLDTLKYGPDCTHVIVENTVNDDPICIAARNDGKVLVTATWVNHSYDAGMSVDPSSVMYRPMIDLNGIQGARSLVICLTGYIRHDRDDIMTMVSLMGAAFSKPLVANKVTHLICYKFEGREKYELAKRMKTIKLVNHRWLQDSLEAWKLLPEADYCKSGYDLEVEAEAKDSEDERESTPENVNIREDVVNRQNTHAESGGFHRSPVAHEASKNTSLNASEALLCAAGTHMIHGIFEHETASVKTLCAFEAPDQNLGKLRSNDLNLPGVLSPERPFLNHETMISNKDEACLSPKSAHKSPVDVPKSSGKIVSRGGLTASPSLEKRESNSRRLASSSTLSEHHVGGLDVDLEGLSNGTHPHTVTTPLKEAPLHPDTEMDITLSNKRKRNTSHSRSKSSKSRGKQVASVERGVGKAILKVLASGSSVNSSDALQDSSSVLLNDACSRKETSLPTEASDITISLVNKQQFSEEKLQPSGGNLVKKTLSKSDVMDFSSGQTTSVSGQLETHENEPHVIEPVSCGTSCGPERVDLESFSTCENSATHTKPVGRKTLARKSLGSRPAIGKGRIIGHKVLVELNKSELLDDSKTKCSEETPKENSDDSFVFEKGMLVSGVNDEDNSKQFPVGSETKSRISDEAGIPDIRGDILPTKKLDDIDSICMKEQSTGIMKINTADAGNLGEESKVRKMRLVSGVARKRLKKDNKRNLGKSKRIASLSLSDEMKGVDCQKMGEEMACSDHDEVSVLICQTRNAASKKLKTLRKMEKENKPNNSLLKSMDVGADAAAGSLTPKLAKKCHHDSLKFNNLNPDSGKGIIIHEEKAGPACFILSGHRLQRKEFQNVIKKLKGRVCRDSHHWSYQATHFIVPDPVKRTEKFFAAAASGSWILKTDYLTACNEAGKFLPEQPYEWHTKCLTEDGAINLEAPRKWRLLKEATGHAALYGMKIIIYGECIAPPLETLKRVVKAGGGAIVATSPPYTRILQSKIDFAVVSPGMPRVDMWIQEFLGHEVPCVLADYLVEFVCKPGYSLEKHVQYNTYSWAKRSLDDHIKRIEEVEDPRTPVNDGNVNDDVVCKGCGRADGGDEMLICGDESGSRGCGVGMHIFCLEPPLQCVPKEDWFCPSCTTNVNQPQM